jgi:hypothetical protein
VTRKETTPPSFDDRTVAIDQAMAAGQVGYPIEPGMRVYVTTGRFDCRGTVANYGPLGIILRDCERIFDTGPDFSGFLQGRPASESVALPGMHFVSWFAAAEITEIVSG